MREKEVSAMAFKRRTEEKVLDVDAAMQGNLSFKDPVNIKINGRFEGNLDTKGNLTVTASAVVSGDIVGDNIIIGGKIKGRITAKERLTLLPTAIVEGEVFPAKLNVAEGAILEGRCTMLHDFLNVEELARYLEVDLNSIMEWANNGKVPGERQGDAWKFDRKTIDTWIASGKVGK